MTVAEKRCNRCGEIKPIEEFGLNRSKSLGRQCACRECDRNHLAVIRQLHREHKVPEDHCCPICGKTAEELHSPSSRTKTPWRLDHDDATGQFRGFLCDRCNTGLGKFGDDPGLLGRAISYLREERG